LGFPFPFSITAQDIGSFFAGKCHALLCCPFVKGRDWYDFLLYVGRKSSINMAFLKNALYQKGSWQNATDDTRRFLKSSDCYLLDDWNEGLF